MVYEPICDPVKLFIIVSTEALNRNDASFVRLLFVRQNNGAAKAEEKRQKGKSLKSNNARNWEE